MSTIDEFESTLSDRIDAIIEGGGYDPESAHGNEDSLMAEAIRLYAPASVCFEFDRLAAAEFPRWCA